ncbi:MAG TPA: sugar ABC transporter permease, partial [Bacillota bacterium]|nr:sugar ABC transporter permease [Bacillota bacterium]
FYENYMPLANGGRGQVTSFFTLANYTKILGDDLFWVAIKNTFIEAFISVPVSIILALLIAVGLKSITKLSKFFQTIFFLPYVTNAIAIGMSFAVMFQRNYGLINAILNWFGIEKINWINTGATWWNQMSALLIYSIWSGLAFKILVFTSGLQNIDKQYYDSAKIDSASKWTVFRRITVPLLSPIILYVSITSLIGALKAYNSVIALFGEKLGATQNSMITIVAFVYKYRSGYTDVAYISYAAAAAIILFLITVVLSILQTVVSKKRVHY